MAKYATKEDQARFISTMTDAIYSQKDLFGLFPSVIIAQGALESGWGLSGLSQKYNNYFGVKASASKFSDAWDPARSKSVNVTTSEFLDGAWNNSYRDNFRVYDSVADSILDHNALIAKAPRYKAALSAATPDDQIREIWQAGYATDPDYVGKVLSIINRYGLRQYDEEYIQRKKKEKPTLPCGCCLP